MGIPLSSSRTDQINFTGATQHFLVFLCLFKKSGDADSNLHTACEPVDLKKKSFLIGAEHFSSGVGEASGGIEALLYLRSVAETAKGRYTQTPAAKFKSWS